MSIQELANIGEFLGAIAVLATLIYLGVQTRQTRQIATCDANRNQIAQTVGCPNRCAVRRSSV